MGNGFDLVSEGEIDLTSFYVGPSRIHKSERRKIDEKKEIKKTREDKILDHLNAREVYYDQIKLTERQKEERRSKHINWVNEKLLRESIEINPEKEIIIKKIDGGIGDGPTLYHAINSGSGMIHRFVVPRDYARAEEARLVVAKMAIDYLKLWKQASKQFKEKYNVI